MSAFEKIIKLEQEFDNRKVELQQIREHKISKASDKIRAKREALDKELKLEVEAIRKATELEVEQMYQELKAKLAANKKAFSDAFIKDKVKIVDVVFNEVKQL